MLRFLPYSGLGCYNANMAFPSQVSHALLMFSLRAFGLVLICAFNRFSFTPRLIVTKTIIPQVNAFLQRALVKPSGGGTNRPEISINACIGLLRPV